MDDSHNEFPTEAVENISRPDRRRMSLEPTEPAPEGADAKSRRRRGPIVHDIPFLGNLATLPSSLAPTLAAAGGAA